MKRAIPTILAICVILVGLGFLLYPDVSDWVHSRHQVGLVQTYTDDVQRLDPAEIADQFERARRYNNALNGTYIEDPFFPGSGAVRRTADYLDILNIGGVMAQVEIPHISVRLPVFHGTGPEVLAKGIGHLEGTSLPVGGQGTHAVLTGHSGLTTARLFTDLERLELGDLFLLDVLDERLAYQVDQILTVFPEEIESLKIEQDADYVTLITCTPYAVNTHRLLVRGVRVPYAPGMAAEIPSVVPSVDWRLVLIGGFVLLFVLLLLFFKRRKKKEEEAGQAG